MKTSIGTFTGASAKASGKSSTKALSKAYKFFGILFALILIIGIAACAAEPAPEGSPNAGMGETGTRPAITADREGNPITLPDRIDTIISMGPATTEIIVALGFADKIIAIDAFSSDIEGLTPDIPQFDMLTPDGERIIALNPDVIFIPGMSRQGGTEDPFQVVSNMGICVIYIPSSTSIDGIMEDIRFTAAVLGAYERAEEIIYDMQREIERIRAIGETITNRKTVYFEISPAPHMVSFGYGTFLDEIINLIGAENVLGDMTSWTSVSEEVILTLNPDVILTSVNFLPDPVEDIITRPGWTAITAVSEGRVYVIDADSSNRPSHNVVRAMREMALAIYPEYF